MSIRQASEQIQKSIDRHPRLTDDGPQGTAIELAVIGHSHLGKGRVPAHDHVAAPLTDACESRPLERTDAFSA